MGVELHPWTMDETLAEIARRVDEGLFTQHVVVNVAKMVNMRRDEELRLLLLPAQPGVASRMVMHYLKLERNNGRK